MTILDAGLDFIDWARSGGRRSCAEVYLSGGRDRCVEVKESEVDLVQESSFSGAGLRFLEGGRMGFSQAAAADSETLKRLYSEAQSQLRYLPADSGRCLPGPSPAPVLADSFEDSLFDGGLLSSPLSGVYEALRGMESAALACDGRVKKVLEISYSESLIETAIAGTSGVEVFRKRTLCGAGITCIAGSGGDIQTGESFQLRAGRAALDMPGLAREADSRAVMLLGGKKLPPGRRFVIFDPVAGVDFVELIACALSAEDVQKGESFLSGKLGHKIAGRQVSFTDDPLMPAGTASSCYDDEGVPARTKLMVREGVLEDYFYDCCTARRAGRESNGSAARASFKSRPFPGHSNFCMKRGTSKKEEIIKNTPDGILVTDIMGMHMTDQATGEFSLGVSGVAVRGGELSHAVKGSMITGNVLEMLAAVDAVADDLVFYGSVGVPTFRVPDMMVA